MYLLYRILSQAIAPLVPAYLAHRLATGKEEKKRLPERLGFPSAERPQGRLVWIHAASIGESNAVLPLVHAMTATFPSVQVLLTTVTVTSARLVQPQLPPRAIHQFAPVDTPKAVRRFMDYWRPDMALWVDSELWPNLLMEAKKRRAVLGIVNARMSEQSFRAWRFARPLMRKMLSCFSFCFAQSEKDAERLLQLGLPQVNAVCNLKYDAPPLTYKEKDFAALKAAMGERPVWVAASTHPGEEEQIGEVHRALSIGFPDLLTVIVPRHANRGDAIAAQLKEFRLAQRSKGNPITPDTQVYLADTMGELGLFYHLAPVAFIGGTLVPHGGQNPLEAARCGCAIILGEHTYNFTEIVSGMKAARAALCVATAQELSAALEELLKNREICLKYGEAAKAYAQSKRGAVEQIMRELGAVL